MNPTRQQHANGGKVLDVALKATAISMPIVLACLGWIGALVLANDDRSKANEQQLKQLEMYRSEFRDDTRAALAEIKAIVMSMDARLRIVETEVKK